MSELANLEIILEVSTRAVDAADLPKVERMSQLVWRKILDAAMANDREALEQIRDRLTAFYAASRSKLKGSETGSKIAALLKYDAALADVASLARPTGLPASNDVNLKKASDRVRRVLKNNPAGLTTTLIAGASQLSRETVSRTLSELKAQGLVRSRKSGRHVISTLTPRGVQAGGGQSGMPAATLRSGLGKVDATRTPIINFLLPREAVAVEHLDKAAALQKAFGALMEGVVKERVSNKVDANDLVRELPRVASL